eukprot:gb/GEZN01006830.1/.p1 GENE.gb/GEZN01006830.1/~~gb/GEZN01006830.1/.p1  ORF type:complete len:471 (-),score=56.54 gb/GEZN01006830.1/:130-1542(-)
MSEAGLLVASTEDESTHIYSNEDLILQEVTPKVYSNKDGQNDSFDGEFTETLVAPVGATFNSAWFNVSNVTIGAGTLSIPYAIQQCGLGLGVIMLLTLASLADFSLRLLVWTAHITGANSFQGVALRTYGKRCAKLVDVMVALNCLAVLLAYIIIIGDLLPSIITEWSGRPASRGLVMGLMVLFGVLPLSLTRTMDFLKHTSLIALVCMSYVLCLVVVWAIASGFDDVANGNIDKDITVSAEIKWFIWGPRIFFALPIMGFAFCSHVQVYQIYSEMADKSVGVMVTVVHYSMATCTTLYLFVGAFGYLTFYDALEGNMLKNFTDSSNVAVMLGKLGLTITLLCSCPLFLPPLRDISYSLYLAPYEAKYVSTPLHALTTVAILLSCYLVALAVPDMADVLALAGSTSSASLMYIFPALFYLTLEHQLENRDSWVAWRGRYGAYLLLFCGVLFGSAGTYVTVIDFIDHDPTQ